MKKIFSLLFIGLTLAIVTAKAQSVAINTSGATANSSAILDVSSSSKGVLIPRMSSVQRNGIATPANGLLVYDNDSLAFAYYNGTTWSFIKGNSSIAAAWSTNGNANTTAASFMGTTDNQDIIFKRNSIKVGLLNTTNTAFGLNAFSANTTGASNAAFGAGALNSNTTGYNNVAIGIAALNKNTDRSNLVAIGDSALYNNISGNDNTAIGSKALSKNTGGSDNTANGFEAMYSNIFGYENTANGSGALYSNTNGVYNTATGSKALYSNTMGFLNTVNGFAVLTTNTTGSFNTVSGANAMHSNTTGYSNTAIGIDALYKNTVRNNLVAIGDSALYNNGTGALGAVEAGFNTAIGSKALYKNTTGYANTANGYTALYNNSTGDFNTANGYEALYNNTDGSYNTANGNGALRANITGSRNSVNGAGALLRNNTGSFNTANGVASLQFNTTGSHNIAMGFIALSNNQTGDLNTAVGDSALYFNTASENTALGAYALSQNNTGTNNVAVGVQAGSSPGNDNGYYNTYIGDSTMMLADRTNSTVIGSKAYTSTNNSMVLGSINGVNGATADVKVGIGVTDPSEKFEIGKGRLRFRGNVTGGNAHGITWTNNAGTIDRAFLGMETDDLFGIYNFGLGNWNVRVHNTSGEVGIFKQPLTTSNDSRLQVKQSGSQNGIGIENANSTNHWDIYLDYGSAPDYNFFYNGSLKSYIRSSDGAYVQVSDKNLKKDITVLQPALQKINTLQPYQYHYLENNSNSNYSIGFMAQDVQKIFPDAVSEKQMKDGKTQLGINYQYFTVLAIKGLQEQQAKIETQDKKIEVLENQMLELKKLVEQHFKKQ